MTDNRSKKEKGKSKKEGTILVCTPPQADKSSPCDLQLTPVLK